MGKKFELELAAHHWWLKSILLRGETVTDEEVWRRTGQTTMEKVLRLSVHHTMLITWTAKTAKYIV